MRPTIYFLVGLAVCFLALRGWQPSSNRYQVVMGKFDAVAPGTLPQTDKTTNTALKIDSVTGKTWILIPRPVWNGNHYQATQEWWEIENYADHLSATLKSP